MDDGHIYTVQLINVAIFLISIFLLDEIPIQLIVYCFLAKILNHVKKWQIPQMINTDKAPTYAGALSWLKQEGKCPEDLEHRQIKYKNNVIECDHGKLKRIIKATLGFKSMKTAYATLKGIEVMRARRKGQASSFYYGQPQGEVCLINRVFGL